MEKSIYAQIAARTGGDIYVGVVGPVRTGKSTLVKRIMETLVIPNISDPYRKERARDELPQSGSGKTIMTAEPKFVPEEAVEVSPDGTSRLRVRMIDSVGYMVDGAVGAIEDGKERMITTPWFDEEIPMTKAAQMGTKKVMQEHCSVGLVVTTDGSVTDIPREDYLSSEAQAIQDMKATGKPFVVVLNCKNPRSAAAQELASSLSQTYDTEVMAVDCQSMESEDIAALLKDLLLAFPMDKMEIHLPRWLDALEWEHPVKKTLYDALGQMAHQITALSQVQQSLSALNGTEPITGTELSSIDLGTGTAVCRIQLPQSLYYEILSQRTGIPISGEGELMRLLIDLSKAKESYDKFADALSEAQATGYGVVLPVREEMKLNPPELVKKNGVSGIRLRASAPSVHIMRVDLDAEVCPMVGSEQQAKDLVEALTQEYQQDTDQLWESNLFGKSVYEMVSSSIETKLRRIPDDVRLKFRSSLSRTVNEGANGMICILF